MSGKVLITSRSFVREEAEAMGLLKEAGLEPVVRIRELPWEEADLLGMVTEVEGIIAGLDPYSARVLAAAPKLRIVARNGVGVDTVDVEAATTRGIYVSNAGSAPAASVADLAMAMVLNLARQIPQAVDETRQGTWRRRVGRVLEGKTLGIVGTGSIGQEVAGRARAFGMGVVAFDTRRDAEWAASSAVRYVELEELLAESDFVSLHIPLTPATRALISKRELEIMKADAYLVNTSRGSIVDEKALFDALQSGTIAGTALDVLEQEPPTDNPLLDLPNVLVTPHIGSSTREATAAACIVAARNVAAVLRGEDPISAVNYAAVKAMEKGC